MEISSQAKIEALQWLTKKNQQLVKEIDDLENQAKSLSRWSRFRTDGRRDHHPILQEQINEIKVKIAAVQLILDDLND